MKIFTKILNLIPSWLLLQRFYKILHTVSIRGMNYGGTGKFSSSGEINVLKHLQNEIQKAPDFQPVIFDVGANIGAYTEILLKYLPPSVRIYSFEPSQSTYKILTDNLENTTVKCFPIGFGIEEEKLKLFHGKNDSQSSLYERGKENDQTSEIVTIRTIDSFCEENNINEIFFLKLDVEGNEFNALSGANKLLKNKMIHQIQFEFGGTNIDSKTTFRDFWELLEDYQLYRIVGDGLFPLRSYDESLEIYYYANYFAKLK